MPTTDPRGSIPTLLSSYSAESLGVRSSSSKDFPRSPLLRSNVSATARSHESLKKSGLIVDSGYGSNKKLALYSSKVYKAYDYEVAEVRPGTPESVDVIDEIPTLDTSEIDFNGHVSPVVEDTFVSESPIERESSPTVVADDIPSVDEADDSVVPNPPLLDIADSYADTPGDDFSENTSPSEEEEEEDVLRFETDDTAALTNKSNRAIDTNVLSPPTTAKYTVVSELSESKEAELVDASTQRVRRDNSRVDAATDFDENLNIPHFWKGTVVDSPVEELEYADQMIQCDLDSDIEAEVEILPPSAAQSHSDIGVQSVDQGTSRPTHAVDTPLRKGYDVSVLSIPEQVSGSKSHSNKSPNSPKYETIHNANLASAVASARKLKDLSSSELVTEYVSQGVSHRYSEFDHASGDTSLLQLNRKFLEEWVDNLNLSYQAHIDSSTTQVPVVPWESKKPIGDQSLWDSLYYHSKQ